MYRLELNYISRDGGNKGKQRDAAKQGHSWPQPLLPTAVAASSRTTAQA